MQLTPQQKEQIRAAKEAGQTRATLDFTVEQKRQWEAAVAAELAGKEENIAHHQGIQDHHSFVAEGSANCPVSMGNSTREANNE